MQAEASVFPSSEPPESSNPRRGGLQVIRRDGQVSAFDPDKITVAMTKAYLAVEGASASGSQRIRETVEGLVRQVVEAACATHGVRLIYRLLA